LHVAGMPLAWAWLAGKQMQVTLVECCGLRKFGLVVAGVDGNTKHEEDLVVMPMLLDSQDRQTVAAPQKAPSHSSL